MRKLLLGSIVLILWFIGSCARETKFTVVPEGPVRHNLIVMAKTKTGVMARGFAGATPPSTNIFCEIGQWRKNETSKADGSFTVELANVDPDIKAGELTFSIGGKHYQQGYRIRDLSQALANITKEPFATDKEVDAIHFFNNHVAILSSQASLVRSFAIDQYFRLGETPTKSVMLSKSNNVLQYPMSLVSVGDHLVISLNRTHQISLVDVNNETVSATAKVTDDQGQLFHFPLTPALTVKNALDADDAGTPSTTIARSLARNPEAVLAVDGTHFLASFVNYYQYEDASLGHKSVVGPGVIALMAVHNGAITTLAREVLPFKNPRFMVAKDQDSVWVSCTGAWSDIGKPTQATSDAGMVRLQLAADHKSFVIAQQIPLPNFAPTMPALVGSTLVIANSDKNDILVMDESATAVIDSNKRVPQFHREFAFTFAKHWHDDIVLLGDALGTLVAYSVSEGFFPFPFVQPVVIDKNIDQRVGLRPQTLFFRSQAEHFDMKEKHPQGYTAWLVSDSQQKIFPMDFLEVFGP